MPHHPVLPRTADRGGRTVPAPGRVRPGLAAEALEVQGIAGRRPAPVGFAADHGDLVVVTAEAKGGKTALLLTLGGRMKPVGGGLRVLGHDLPRGARRVRALTGLATVRGVNDLDASLTVADHVAERLLFQRPWWRPWASRSAVAGVLATANAVIEDLNAASPLPGGRLEPLVGRHFITDLSPLDQFVLGVALALIGAPQLLLVDDIDVLRTRQDRATAWAALLALLDAADRPTTVVTCEDDTGLAELLGAGAVHAPPVRRVHLSTPTRH